MEGLLLRTTFNIGNVDVDQKNRAAGSSGYNLKKLLSTWVNGLTTFSVKPLRLAVILGMLMAIAAFVIVIILLCIKICILKKSAREISAQVSDRLKDDTNNLIYISSSDRDMRHLAENLNAELKDMRKKQLQYE